MNYWNLGQLLFCCDGSKCLFWGYDKEGDAYFFDGLEVQWGDPDQYQIITRHGVPYLGRFVHATDLEGVYYGMLLQEDYILEAAAKHLDAEMNRQSHPFVEPGEVMTMVGDDDG